MLPQIEIGRALSAREAGFKFCPPPFGACNRWIPKLLVGKHLREAAVFLGQKNEQGEFIAHGTGFLVCVQAYGRALAYLVTAKHVLDDIPGAIVHLRGNGVGGTGLKYMELPKKDWQFHPEHREIGPRKNYIDVAVYAGQLFWTELEFIVTDSDQVASESIIAEYDIGIGDEVAIVGLFYSHIGAEKNISIVRTGNIAAMREEPVPTSRGMMDGYLVESRSIGGVSGSPVFVNMAVRPDTVFPEWTSSVPWEKKPVKKSEHTYYLLGLVHGYYTLVDQHEWVSKTDQQVGDINTGISVVVPAEKILETVMPVAKKGIELARDLDEVEKRRSGAKTASVSSGKVRPSTDENPTHRADFNRLLDVAAKTPPQDD